VPWETVEHFAQGGFLFVRRFVSEQVEIFWPHCFWKLLLNELQTRKEFTLTEQQKKMIACLSKTMEYPPKNLPTAQASVFGAVTFELMVATLIAVRSGLYHDQSKFFYFLF
jgi:hypothetical protein